MKGTERKRERERKKEKRTHTERENEKQREKERVKERKKERDTKRVREKDEEWVSTRWPLKYFSFFYSEPGVGFLSKKPLQNSSSKNSLNSKIL